MSLDWQYDRRIGNGGPWGSGFGYTYLGPISQPPLVPAVGMTDENGKVWWLYWDGNDHLLLSDSLSAALQNNYTYKQGDGPYLGATGMILSVSVKVPGHLGEPHLIVNYPIKSAGHPVFCPNVHAPLGQEYPEPSNYPAPGIPAIPGIPSSTPPPTGGGFAAFEAAYQTNNPPLLTSVATPILRDIFHLIFYREDVLPVYGTNGDILVWENGAWTSQRPKYIVASSIGNGVLTNSQALLYHRFAKNVTFPSNFGPYLNLVSEAGGTANATNPVTINVDKALAATPNTFTTIGTITFAAGTTTPTFSTSNTSVSFAQGDILRLVNQVSADATFAGFYATLVGYET